MFTHGYKAFLVYRYPNFAWWEKCEFCPTFAYSKTLVSQTKVVHPYKCNKCNLYHKGKPAIVIQKLNFQFSCFGPFIVFVQETSFYISLHNCWVRVEGTDLYIKALGIRPWCIFGLGVFCLQVFRPTSQSMVSQSTLQPSAVAPT